MIIVDDHSSDTDMIKVLGAIFLAVLCVFLPVSCHLVEHVDIGLKQYSL